MCLLIANPCAVSIPVSNLSNGFEANPDGAGYAFARKGKAITRKGFFSFADFLKSWQFDGADAYPSIIHFRLATHGGKCKANCHPFNLPNGSVAAHNGIISGLSAVMRKNETDTSAWMRTFLAPFIRADIRSLQNHSTISLLESTIPGSKVAVLHKNGEIDILNENAGDYDGGVWYSNLSYEGFGSYCSPGISRGKRYSRNQILTFDDVSGSDNDAGEAVCIECGWPENGAVKTVIDPVTGICNLCSGFPDESDTERDNVYPPRFF